MTRSSCHDAEMAEEARLIELISPEVTNHYGTLFGGHALGLMDKAGYIAATRYSRRTMVTVASDRVEFKVPVRAGQLVELVARVERVGRTSVTVGVDMFVEDLLTAHRQLATTGSFVFVAVDETGRATPVRREAEQRSAEPD
jgi:acyl-CoA hydrolase